jgi:hypothetical protein
MFLVLVIPMFLSRENTCDDLWEKDQQQHNCRGDPKHGDANGTPSLALIPAKVQLREPQYKQDTRCS